VIDTSNCFTSFLELFEFCVSLIMAMAMKGAEILEIVVIPILVSMVDLYHVLISKGQFAPSVVRVLSLLAFPSLVASFG
jgi:hypothetical protein